MNSVRTVNRAHLFRLHSTGKITFSIFRKIFVQNEPMIGLMYKFLNSRPTVIDPCTYMNALSLSEKMTYRMTLLYPRYNVYMMILAF